MSKKSNSTSRERPLATGDDQPFLTSGQVAERWKVSKRTVERLAKQGELRRLCIGRQVRFRMEDIIAYEKGVTS